MQGLETVIPRERSMKKHIVVELGGVVSKERLSSKAIYVQPI